jgi:hypothetical protein
MAVSGFGSPTLKKFDLQGSKRVRHQSFRDERKGDLGFQLLNLQAIDLQTSMKSFLLSEGVSSLFELRPESSVSHNERGRTSQSFRFFVSGFEVCDAYVKVHHMPGQQPYIVGQVPTFQPSNTYTIQDWPNRLDAVAEATINLAYEIGDLPENVILSSAKPCLLSPWGDQPLPVWDMVISFGRLTYQVTADAVETYSLNRQFFDVTGSLKAYEKNPDDGKLTNFSVTLSGDGFLTNDYFKTYTNGVARARKNDHRFDFLPTAPEFPEVNIFSHANRIHKWFESLGYKGTGQQILIRVHELIPTGAGGESNPNNAVYMPAGYDGKSAPMIAIGDGDGVILKNLSLDSDVVSHEFGHHVIFQNLKSTNLKETGDNIDHSGALHEGLADFFAFAQSGDDCLGDSICPEGSPACYFINQCLRSANNTIKFNDEEYNSLRVAIHLKGQLVSGYLWDIKKRENVDASEWISLVFASLDYLPQASSYTDFLLSLMAADRELYNGKYGCAITEAAKDRGFSDIIEVEVDDCGTFNPELDESGKVKSTLSSETPVSGEIETNSGSQRRSEKKSSSGGCGKISYGHQGTPLNWFTLAIIFLPILLPLGRSVRRSPLPSSIK